MAALRGLGWAGTALADHQAELHAGFPPWTKPVSLIYIAISSTSFEHAFRLYVELLGLPLTPAQGISYSPVLLFDLPTGEQFHCHLHGPSQHMHVALEVADFEGALKRLREVGVQVRNTDKRGDGSDFLFCKDFDGNTIELTYHKTWTHHKLVGNG